MGIEPTTTTLATWYSTTELHPQTGAAAQAVDYSATRKWCKGQGKGGFKSSRVEKFEEFRGREDEVLRRDSGGSAAAATEWSAREIAPEAQLTPRGGRELHRRKPAGPC